MKVYENEHFGTKPDAANAKLCKKCYGELTKDPQEATLGLRPSFEYLETKK